MQVLLYAFSKQSKKMNVQRREDDIRKDRKDKAEIDSDVQCVLESQKASTFLTDFLIYKIELVGTGNCKITVWSLNKFWRN